MIDLIKHPTKCPNCWGKNTFTYERFDPETEHGSYLCDDCGFCFDAYTGNILNEGETWDKIEEFKQAWNNFLNKIVYNFKLRTFLDWLEYKLNKLRRK